MRRSDGKADTVAHLVLVCLAVYADGDRRARPSLSTLATDARLTERAAKDALSRLVDAELVSPAGDFNGTTVWKLNTGRERSDGERTEAQSRRDVARQKHAERARRYRARKAARDAEAERDVTPNQSVTEDSVTSNLDARDAEVERTSRSTSTHVTPSTPSQPQVSPPVTANELPLNCQGTAMSSAAPTSERPAPPAQPKKPRKSKPDNPKDVQAQELAQRYYEAMNGMVPFMGVRTIVKHALGRFSYQQVHDALRQMSTQDRNRTLTRQSLLAAIEGHRATGGHQPYRNPVDQSVYDEPLI